MTGQICWAIVASRIVLMDQVERDLLLLEQQLHDLVGDHRERLEHPLAGAARRPRPCRRGSARGGRSRPCRRRSRRPPCVEQVDDALEVRLRRRSGSGAARRSGRASLSSCSMTLAGLAPVRSILLMNAIRGTLYRFIWRSTVIDCDCTPATAQRTRTAPSSTRSDRSTSTVKSTWPGVSMMLILLSFQRDRRGGRGDRDPSLLLELHVVHHRPFAPDLLDHVGRAGVEQDPLGQRGLARVDVGRDADVAQVAKVFHGPITLNRRQKGGTPLSRPETTHYSRKGGNRRSVVPKTERRHAEDSRRGSIESF